MESGFFSDYPTTCARLKTNGRALYSPSRQCDRRSSQCGVEMGEASAGNLLWEIQASSTRALGLEAVEKFEVLLI